MPACRCSGNRDDRESHRAADGLHVNPDLVGAPGLQRQKQLGAVSVRIVGQTPVVSAGIFSVLRIDAALNHGSILSCDGKGDGPFFFRSSGDDGGVGPMDASFRHHGG